MRGSGLRGSGTARGRCEKVRPRRVDGIAAAAEPSRWLAPCLITYRMIGPCDNCGRQASPVHMPRSEHGLYCAECCPVCSGRSKPDQPKSPEAGL